MGENEIAAIVVDTCIKIHRKLGSGLLESAYEAILAYELAKNDISVQRQVPIPIIWDDLVVEDSFRADLILNKVLLVELKATEKSNPLFARQVLTYLKLTGIKLGLLINFGSPLMKDGIERIVNGLEE